MELRQLRSFIRVVESGSLGHAAVALELSEQDLAAEMASLEREVATPLLRELADGITPTEAGIRFFQEAQLTLRHADQALRAKGDAPLTGAVRIGLTPTAATVLCLPFMRSMLERYPGVQLQLVEGLSGHLAGLLGTHRLDLAVLYGAYPGRGWAMVPLLNQRLYFIQSASRPARAPLPPALRMSELHGVPLILPSSAHGLRTLLDAAFSRYRVQPSIVAEIDSNAMLMDAVGAGFGATLQALSATTRFHEAAAQLEYAPLLDPEAQRVCTLCSLPNGRLSPAAMAARVVLAVCARDLVRSGAWKGAEASTG